MTIYFLCWRCSGRGTDILLGGNPKGLTLAVLSSMLGPTLLEGESAASVHRKLGRCVVAPTVEESNIAVLVKNEYLLTTLSS